MWGWLDRYVTFLTCGNICSCFVHTYVFGLEFSIRNVKVPSTFKFNILQIKTTSLNRHNASKWRNILTNLYIIHIWKYFNHAVTMMVSKMWSQQPEWIRCVHPFLISPGNSNVLLKLLRIFLYFLVLCPFDILLSPQGPQYSLIFSALVKICSLHKSQ